MSGSWIVWQADGGLGEGRKRPSEKS